MGRTLAIALAALAVLPATARAGEVRFSLPVPTAGDVTLARAQFITTGRAAAYAKPGGTAGFADGVRVAQISTEPVRLPSRSLYDVFYAVAAPIERGAPKNPSRFTIRVSKRHGRVRLVHLLAVPDALARADKEGATCPILSGGFGEAQRSVAGWLLARSGPRWAGLSARTFALDAFHYGCGDGVAAGGGLF